MSWNTNLTGPHLQIAASAAPRIRVMAVFVDESGDHGLARVDPGYPIFVLAFCLFAKSDYVAPCSRTGLMTLWPRNSAGLRRVKRKVGD